MAESTPFSLIFCRMSPIASAMRLLYPSASSRAKAPLFTRMPSLSSNALRASSACTGAGAAGAAASGGEAPGGRASAAALRAARMSAKASSTTRARRQPSSGSSS